MNLMASQVSNIKSCRSNDTGATSRFLPFRRKSFGCGLSPPHHRELKETLRVRGYGKILPPILGVQSFLLYLIHQKKISSYLWFDHQQNHITRA